MLHFIYFLVYFIAMFMYVFIYLFTYLILTNSAFHNSELGKLSVHLFWGWWGTILTFFERLNISLLFCLFCDIHA